MIKLASFVHALTEAAASLSRSLSLSLSRRSFAQQRATVEGEGILVGGRGWFSPKVIETASFVIRAEVSPFVPS